MPPERGASSISSATQPIELCVVSQNADFVEAARAAAAKAGITFNTTACCATCDVPCKPIVAIDVADPNNVNSASHAHGKNGGHVLIAIAPESMTIQQVKSQGYDFVVYQTLMERFLPTILRISSSLLASK